MPTRYQIIKYLTPVIFILPMFYDYMSVLPSATKHAMDLLIIGYFLLYKPLRQKRSLRTSGFKSIYFFYITIIIILSLYSVLAHNEGMVVFVQEVRRLVIPLALYIMFSDLAAEEKDSFVNYHKVIAAMLLLQIPVTIIERLSYAKIYPTFLFRGKEISEIDFAMGTIGAGGASILGIVFPLAIIYFYDLKQYKYIPFFVVALIVIYSGGGMVLLMATAGGIVLYNFVVKSYVIKFRIIIITALGIALLFVAYTIPIFGNSIDKFISSLDQTYENQVLEGREVFENQEHKIDRVNGYKFFNRHMNEYKLEHIWGLGFTFKNNKTGTYPYQYKSDLNFFIGERGYLGLTVFAIYMIAFLIGVIRMLKFNSHHDRFIKLLYFLIYFFAIFYNPPTRSYVMWLLFIYVLVLYEHKGQYLHLTEYLNERKRSNHRKKRGIKTDSLPEEFGALS